MQDSEDTETKRQDRSPAALTDAEWAIMKVVWHRQPCAAGTVQEALEHSRQWAYSTVKTTMDRMATKGLLKVKKVRNLQLFSASITETDARRGEFRTMLKKAFDGAMTPMMQFLMEEDALSADEITQLRRIVAGTEHAGNSSSEQEV